MHSLRNCFRPCRPAAAPASSCRPASRPMRRQRPFFADLDRRKELRRCLTSRTECIFPTVAQSHQILPADHWTGGARKGGFRVFLDAMPRNSLIPNDGSISRRKNRLHQPEHKDCAGVPRTRRCTDLRQEYMAACRFSLMTIEAKRVILGAFRYMSRTCLNMQRISRRVSTAASDWLRCDEGPTGEVWM